MYLALLRKRERIQDFSLPHNPHWSPSKSRPPPRRGVTAYIVLSSATASTRDERPLFIGKVRLKVRREPRVSPHFSYDFGHPSFVQLTGTSFELSVIPRSLVKL
ncbi:hypothetical protein V6N12_037234 [Hibiscus sabdariffa]|uniref:Uncharacterized protein n=1 Tax=Hibiscus sabdariffa TaxID=183260 RepID=A0ABR2C3H5_9ROSI